jgi:hypothetical protein
MSEFFGRYVSEDAQQLRATVASALQPSENPLGYLLRLAYPTRLPEVFDLEQVMKVMQELRSSLQQLPTELRMALMSVWADHTVMLPFEAWRKQLPGGGARQHS